MKKKRESYWHNLWNNKKKVFWGVITIYILVIFITSIFQSVVFALSDKFVFIPIDGAITMGGSDNMFSSGALNSEDIIEMIEKASEDDTVKAIILDINSPGGTVVASKEIADALKEVEKPKMSLIREVGASGAYWVASATDTIFVDELSITGSIGVVGSYLQFSKFLADHNVTYEELSAGSYKEAGNMFRELTEKDREYLQAKINVIYDFFIKEVAENRGMEVSAVEELADGKFYLGYEALEYGLVDRIGNKKDVISYVEELTGVSDAEEVIYTHKKGILSSLFGVLDKFSFGVGKGIGSYVYGRGNDIKMVV